ncbi:unnamed protein product [Chondrus crispus]|uniref:Uncharacterized protein n=1 Tax=Chondrus crispus TaxID=2769 RepID=R7QLX0_CHOCR|nr:unnamed protein product [Chondrus crispus]CDF39094.1 unnamed protein product [Chondrus crispus]|eukprot:XP_005719005.1 unnamed protein product [Chondrus crispus]
MLHRADLPITAIVISDGFWQAAVIQEARGGNESHSHAGPGQGRGDKAQDDEDAHDNGGPLGILEIRELDNALQPAREDEPLLLDGGPVVRAVPNLGHERARHTLLQLVLENLVLVHVEHHELLSVVCVLDGEALDGSVDVVVRGVLGHAQRAVRVGRGGRPPTLGGRVAVLAPESEQHARRAPLPAQGRRARTQRGTRERRLRQYVGRARRYQERGDEGHRRGRGRSVRGGGAELGRGAWAGGGKGVGGRGGV